MPENSEIIFAWHVTPYNFKKQVMSLFMIAGGDRRRTGDGEREREREREGRGGGGVGERERG